MAPNCSVCFQEKRVVKSVGITPTVLWERRLVLAGIMRLQSFNWQWRSENNHERRENDHAGHTIDVMLHRRESSTDSLMFNPESHACRACLFIQVTPWLVGDTIRSTDRRMKGEVRTFDGTLDTMSTTILIHKASLGRRTWHLRTRVCITGMSREALWCRISQESWKKDTEDIAWITGNSQENSWHRHEWIKDVGRWEETLLANLRKNDLLCLSTSLEKVH